MRSMIEIVEMLAVFVGRSVLPSVVRDEMA